MVNEDVDNVIHDVGEVTKERIISMLSKAT
jgi:hypothetical protein